MRFFVSPLLLSAKTTDLNDLGGILRKKNEFLSDNIGDLQKTFEEKAFKNFNLVIFLLELFRNSEPENLAVFDTTLRQRSLRRKVCKLRYFPRYLISNFGL